MLHQVNSADLRFDPDLEGAYTLLVRGAVSLAKRSTWLEIISGTARRPSLPPKKQPSKCFFSLFRNFRLSQQPLSLKKRNDVGEPSLGLKITT
jgi:hypothetical protein